MNYFANRLAHETDAADVAEALGNGAFTVIDSRSEQAYDDAHIPGAICLRRTDPACRHATMYVPVLKVICTSM